MAKEKRLIDANDLWEKAEALETSTALKWGWQEMCDGMCQVKDLISKAPTVDAVEVVHSQWDTVFYERNGTLASYSHICPKCKYFYRDVHFKGYNYCPKCGADMR